MARETAIIVGVGPGLGWALARRFAQARMQVVAAARDASKIEPLARTNEAASIRFEPCDATQPDDVARLFATIEEAFGPPDLVVFNAGTFEPGGILDITPEAFERCWRVGCLGGFLVGRSAARLMIAAGKGTIIFTGATASLRGSANFANLAVPKFGLRALAQSMAREFGPKGIHVAHVVIDGQIETDRVRSSQPLPASRLPADAIAETYYQLHLQPRGAWTLELDLRPWVEKF